LGKKGCVSFGYEMRCEVYWVGVWKEKTYVRPVERRTPARKADTVRVLGV
jgi:hypothetical protein